MPKLWRLYDGATTGLLALTGGAMFAVIIVNAVLRYFFATPLVWAEEIARYCMIWGTLLGVALGYRAGAHVAITLLTDAAPRGVLIAFRLVCHVLVLLVAALLWRSGGALASLLGMIEAPSSGIGMIWIYAAIPAGAVLLAIEALRHLVADIGGLVRRVAP